MGVLIKKFGYLSKLEFLKKIEQSLFLNISLNEITEFFINDHNYIIEKPYLIRRIIKSTYLGIDSFEIVYDSAEKIYALVINVKLNLKELYSLFGKFEVLYEPYSNSSAFLFKSNNPCISLIKTRLNIIVINSNKNFIEYKLNDKLYKDINPEFNFIQFNFPTSS